MHYKGHRVPIGGYLREVVGIQVRARWFGSGTNLGVSGTFECSQIWIVHLAPWTGNIPRKCRAGTRERVCAR